MVKPKRIDEIDAEVVLVEAANTLYRAADLADRMNDSDAMMNVVAGWLEVHERFTDAQINKPRQIGFCAPEAEVVEVEESEEILVEEEE